MASNDFRVDSERGPYTSTSALVGKDSTNTTLWIFKKTSNSLAHILLIFVVVLCWVCVFDANSLPLSATPIHILLCVTGHQLLMAEATLSLSPENTWSGSLSLLNKKRVHWILQILGSGLAIVGSMIKIIDKEQQGQLHWNTNHGQFALVALVFTVVSLVNGVASLWAYEVRHIFPPKLSKLTHICFGTVGFAASSISLCYGFDKNSFRNWSSQTFAEVAIGITTAFTALIIINPLINFVMKLFNRK